MSRRHARGMRALNDRAPEGEIVADAFDGCARADQVEIPQAVGSIAEQHRAYEAAVRDDELLVKAYPGIAENDFFGALAPKKIARSEERRVGKECRSRWSPYH